MASVQVSRMGPTVTVKPSTTPPKPNTPVRTGDTGGKDYKSSYAAAGVVSGAASGAKSYGAAGAVVGAIVGVVGGTKKGVAAQREANIQATLAQAFTGDPNDPSTKAARLEVQTSSELRQRAKAGYGADILSPEEAKAKRIADAQQGIYTGSVVQTKAAIAAQNNQSSMGMFDYVSGINIGQPSVQSGTGQVTVPSNQSGSGIWGSLLNLGAAAVTNYLTKPKATQSQVQPTVTQNLVPQGSTSIPLGGGIVLSTNGQLSYPVTTNTTSGNPSNSSDTPGWLWPVILLVGLFFLFRPNR